MWWNGGGGVLARKKKKKSERFLVGGDLKGKIAKRESRSSFPFFSSC